MYVVHYHVMSLEEPIDDMYTILVMYHRLATIHFMELALVFFQFFRSNLFTTITTTTATTV